MKIPLRIRKQFDELMAFANATIRAPHIRRPVPIEFLVDTGSPWIAIAPRDVKKVNISISALKKPQKLSPYFLLGQSSGDIYWKMLPCMR